MSTLRRDVHEMPSQPGCLRTSSVRRGEVEVARTCRRQNSTSTMLPWPRPAGMFASRQLHRLNQCSGSAPTGQADPAIALPTAGLGA